MIIVYSKSTWVKRKIFTQVEKHIQILTMFRNSTTVEYFFINISFYFTEIDYHEKFRYQTDRLNVTAIKNSYINFRKIF